jgi:hypothetical protein
MSKEQRVGEAVKEAVELIRDSVSDSGAEVLTAVLKFLSSELRQCVLGRTVSHVSNNYLVLVFRFIQFKKTA